MKTFLTLLSREVKSFFYSPIAYVVLFYFLFLNGYNFFQIVNVMNGAPVERTLVEVFFLSPFFWFPFMLSFPLITMRTYSEEYRMGTFETLATAPVKDTQIVLAKFFGTMVFFSILWAPTLVSFAAFNYVTGKSAAGAAGAYWSTYLLLFLIGCLYNSIGCLASSLTKDQIVAATISFTTIMFMFFLSFLPDILGVSNVLVKEAFGYVSAFEHMLDFSKGMIDSRPLVWYVSMTILFLVINLQVFQYRKWKA